MKKIYKYAWFVHKEVFRKKAFALARIRELRKKWIQENPGMDKRLYRPQAEKRRVTLEFWDSLPLLEKS